MGGDTGELAEIALRFRTNTQILTGVNRLSWIAQVPIIQFSKPYFKEIFICLYLWREYCCKVPAETCSSSFTKLYLGRLSIVYYPMVIDKE
jgi:hypothetical protein